MGRLVEPISAEEFAKLPKWQQWLGNYPITTVTILAVILVGLCGILRWGK